MPRKGERQPYRVIYTYPDRPEGRIPFTWRSVAVAEGAAIGKRGADVTVCQLDDKGRPTTIATFGPDVLHLIEWINPDNPTNGARCRCGYVATFDDTSKDVADHMTQAGLCPECWGTGMVAQRATRDGGKPMAGDLIDCPVCGGTGQDVDVSYHDVDTSTYYNRFQMLELETS
jgi:hypothetical protein